jgi:DNA-binding LytR/AlgR family response regulator
MDIQLDDWISFEIFDSVKYKSRFFIKVGMRYQSVPVEEICCFFVEERNSFIRTQRGKTYDLDFSLDQVQKMIDPALFFRINLNCISEILTYSTNRLKLKLNHYDNDDLIVSRNKVSEFKSWMDR